VLDVAGAVVEVWATVVDVEDSPVVVVGASGVVVDVDEVEVGCARGRNVITTGGFGVGGDVSGTATVDELLDELDDELLDEEELLDELEDELLDELEDELLEELEEEELLEELEDELLDDDDSGGPSTQTHTMT